MDGRETKGVGSKKIFRGSKFQVEGEKKLKCDFLSNFNINDQTQNFRNVKIGGEKKTQTNPKIPQFKKKEPVLGNIYVRFFPYEIFSESFGIT